MSWILFSLNEDGYIKELQRPHIKKLLTLLQKAGFISDDVRMTETGKDAYSRFFT